MNKTSSLHENIKSHQAQTALRYSECKPSEVTDVCWIYAIRKIGTYAEATDQSGKWLVFVPVSQIDEVWAKIKLATEEGKLGGASKVSTGLSNPNAMEPEEKVICVYTYDWTDEEDVTRIREELRNLGITRKIPYKSDEDTLQGKYRVNGYTRISKRYE